MPDERAKPRNRTVEVLESGDIRVHHADGVLRLDPNQQIEELHFRPGNILGLRPVPGAASVISGAPAIVYRTYDIEIPLTVWEYVGLVDRSLEPAEFHALMDRYGDFFEIHDDYYCPGTGGAFQPHGLRDDLRDIAAEAGLIPAPATLEQPASTA